MRNDEMFPVDKKVNAMKYVRWRAMRKLKRFVFSFMEREEGGNGFKIKHDFAYSVYKRTDIHELILSTVKICSVLRLLSWFWRNICSRPRD
jgi:hypothetical protein